MTTADGMYKGTPEHSLVVELWDAEDSVVRDAAMRIAEVNHQESVAIVKLADAAPEFVSAPARAEAVATVEQAHAAGYRWNGTEQEWESY